ncbi:MAG: hypothetical protein ABL866_11830 [Devosia sp.]
MTKSREMVLIGGTVKLLRERHSWAGETHIQKTAFVSKVLKGVPFESEFVLYKHGPFSFEMSTSLVHMRTRGLLSISQNPGYGPSFDVNEPLWKALDRTASQYFEQYEADLAAVCDVLATKNVAWLERVATATYLNSLRPNASVEERTNELVQLKPHIPYALARDAFDEVASIS